MPVTEAKKLINLHVLFDPSLNISIIEREFFRKLKFSYKDCNYSCIKGDLIELGRAYKSNPKLEEPAAWREGVGQFNVSFTEVKKILEGNILKEKYIVGVSNNSKDGNSGIRHSSLAATRQEIYRLSDFIFSGNPKDILYFLGENGDSKEKIIENFGSIKPCITGSDAHSINSINVFGKDRFTWIKADPTFEGLKQTLIEPKERVFIGEEPEILKRVSINQTKYIKGLKINSIEGYEDQHGEWFKDIDIKFNKELVAIIGNKGSGKSALSDITALCGNFKEHDNFSFLKDNKFRKGKLAENFKSKLTWESDGEIEKNLGDSTKDGEILKIKYLPQGDFENLTNEIEKAESFTKEIQNIVFSHINEEEKLGENTFESLINKQKRVSEEKTNSIKIVIKELNKEIIDLEKKLDPKYKIDVEGKIREKKAELKALKEPEEVKNPNSDPEMSDKNKEANNRITAINEKIKEFEKELSDDTELRKKLIIDKEELNELNDSIDVKIKELNDFRDSVKESLDKYKISIEDILKIDLNLSSIEFSIIEKEHRIEELSKKIDGTKDQEGLISKIEKENKLLSIEQNNLDGPQKEYHKYLSEKKEWDKNKDKIIGKEDTFGTLKYYQNEILYLEKELESAINEKRNNRMIKVKEIFKNKNSVLDIYKKIKKGVDGKIEENNDLLGTYKINIDASLSLKNIFNKEFLNYISQNKVGSFFSKEGGEQQLKDLLEGKQVNRIEDIEKLLNEVIDCLFKDKREKQENADRFIGDQIKDLESFYEFLFSLNYIEYSYQLKLGTKEIEQLSPGERGTLLLIFYLLLDKNDIPLILDQPEDNLDNNSVANVLVPFIRRAKRKRQIILVTHNPNLAVVADAEQIIWVDIDKEKKNKFKFISGSIENREINKKLVDVLEGAMPAFNKRKEKYYE